MKTRAKLMMLLAISLSLFIALAGCSTQNNPEVSSQPETAQPETLQSSTQLESSQPETVDITFSSVWVREEMNSLTYPLDLLDAYLQANPNIKLTLNTYNSSDYQNTVFKTMAAADNLPEMFQINMMDYKFCEEAGLLMDWTSVINADTSWSDRFLTGAFNETTFNGKIIAIPYQFITNECIYYNKDILKEVGYDAVPADWDNFLILCDKLKAANYIPIALGDKGAWPLCSNVMEVLCDYVCGPEWVNEVGAYSGKAGYDDPRFISVLTLMNDFIQKGYMNEDMVSIDNNTQDKAYLFNLKAAMLFGGSYTLSNIASQAPEDLIGSISVAPIPRPNNSVADYEAGLFTGGSGWSYAISSKASEAQQQAAIGIIKMFTGNEFAKNDIENNKISVIKTSSVTGVDQSKVLPLQTIMNNLIAKAPRITLMGMQQNGSMSNVIYKELQAMAVGSVTPTQAAQDIQTAFAAACASTK